MKKFLVMLAIIFAGNIFASNVHAEIKNYAGRGAALLDFTDEKPEYVETAKNVAKLRAIKKAFERAGFFILSFTSETLHGKTTDEYISAIVRDMATIEGEEIKKYYFNSEEYNRPGYIYEANLIAKIDTEKIAKYLQLDATEKQKLIERDKTAKKNFEEIDNDFENLRKTADKKTPAQIKTELEKIDSKISGQNKPVEQKNIPMIFSQPQKIGLFCFINLRDGIEILDESHKNEIPNPISFRANIPYGTKGVKQVNNGEDALYIHYDSKNHKYFFGGKEINDTFEARFVEGLIYKISTNSKITLYCIESGYDIPEDDQYTVYGKRADGKFVKYIDTIDIAKKYFGNEFGYWFEKITFKNDLIIIEYRRFSNNNFNNITERGEFRFKWDDAAQWFGIEKVTY